MRAKIAYNGGELEALFRGDRWVVKLGELEESSSYLDYALACLLDVGNREVHHLATRLVDQLLTPPAPEGRFEYTIELDDSSRHQYRGPRAVVEREVLDVLGGHVVVEEIVAPANGRAGLIRARRMRLGRRS